MHDCMRLQTDAIASPPVSFTLVLSSSTIICGRDVVGRGGAAGAIFYLSFEPLPPLLQVGEFRSNKVK